MNTNYETRWNAICPGVPYNQKVIEAITPTYQTDESGDIKTVHTNCFYCPPDADPNDKKIITKEKLLVHNDKIRDGNHTVWGIIKHDINHKVGKAHSFGISEVDPNLFICQIDLLGKDQCNPENYEYLQKKLKSGEIYAVSIGMRSFEDGERIIDEISFVENPKEKRATIYHLKQSDEEKVNWSVGTTLFDQLTMGDAIPQPQQQQAAAPASFPQVQPTASQRIPQTNNNQYPQVQYQMSEADSKRLRELEEHAKKLEEKQKRYTEKYNDKLGKFSSKASEALKKAEMPKELRESVGKTLKERFSDPEFEPDLKNVKAMIAHYDALVSKFEEEKKRNVESTTANTAKLTELNTLIEQQKATIAELTKKLSEHDEVAKAEAEKLRNASNPAANMLKPQLPLMQTGAQKRIPDGPLIGAKRQALGKGPAPVVVQQGETMEMDNLERMLLANLPYEEQEKALRAVRNQYQ